MPDNPNPHSHPFRLPGFGILAISGRDAVAFAHAQFTSEVAALAPGHWHWSGWLTPKGRVIALFALMRLDDETVWLLLPDMDAGELAARLQRFVFRGKLALRARDDLHATGVFAAPATAQASAFGRHGDSIELDMGGNGQPRTLRIESGASDNDARSRSEWLAFDLAHGLPRLPESQRELWTPQQLSLQRLRAFSVKKGCYPGQEIVARTHFLGQAKRGLVALSSTLAIAVGADVQLDGTSIGRTVSATPEAPFVALAVLPLERGPGALHANGADLEEIVLRDGLER